MSTCVRTTCTKCGTEITLDFGDATKEQALEIAEKMDKQSRECPGWHVELSGWRRMWQLDDAIHRAYDLGETCPASEPPTDEDHIKILQDAGYIVIAGSAALAEQHHLQDIHEYPDLEHIGMGYFKNAEFHFDRCDSPSHSRFYTKHAN
jgi:hypothetical protein